MPDFLTYVVGEISELDLLYRIIINERHELETRLEEVEKRIFNYQSERKMLESRIRNLTKVTSWISGRISELSKIRVETIRKQREENGNNEGNTNSPS